MYKRILVPVDGSDTSKKALDAALQMARDNDGIVRIVHLVDELAYLSGYDLYGGYSGELIKMMREAGTSILQESLAKAQAANVSADTAILEKFGERLGETVAEAARQYKADLVVVGTHGRRGVGRALLGSGAEQIIRLAPVPVLVVRGEET
jgi:nucleotide-binding universal stress UspA family protein